MMGGAGLGMSDSKRKPDAQRDAEVGRGEETQAYGSADAVVRVHGDESLWNTLSARGLENVREHFSFDAARAALRRILSIS